MATDTEIRSYGSVSFPSPDSEGEENEEEEEVKSKPKTPLCTSSFNNELDEDEIPTLESHIDSRPPPNDRERSASITNRERQGTITSSRVPLLELAERSRDTDSLQRMWEGKGEFGLSGKFKVQGKSCIMRLEDDALHWTWTGKGGIPGGVVYLSLADIFAVVMTNRRGRPDSTHGTQFIIHALRSKGGSCGQLLELTCVPLDPHPNATAQTWTEYLSQQIQNFGHRPRRLYIVINPISGSGSSLATWSKVEHLFRLANVHTEIFVTQRRFHAREVIQTLDVDNYDGIIVVGGDGIFNEVLNGLILQTQQTAGIDMRGGRFVPVAPHIRLGIIPAGFSNTVGWSVLGTKCPFESTAQILLGCSSPVDVCSLFNTGQLLLFSAGPLSYGLQAEVTMFSNDFSWLGKRRIDVAQLRALLSNRDFETEIQYIPVDDNPVTSRDKCYSRCPKCGNYDGEPTSSVVSEKGASVMATYSNISRTSQQEWKKIHGTFCTVIACPLTCRSRQAPEGMSPWAHQANGCIDLIMIRHCSKMDLIKWFMKQRRNTQLELPYVQIQRVKEFKFREFVRPLPGRAEEEVNLVNDEREDEDEITNREAGGGVRGGVNSGTINSAGGRELNRQSSRNRDTPTSHWNIDGDDMNRVDIDVRVHRHLLQMFARGIEPLEGEGEEEEAGSRRSGSVGSRNEILNKSIDPLIP